MKRWLCALLCAALLLGSALLPAAGENSRGVRFSAALSGETLHAGTDGQRVTLDICGAPAFSADAFEYEVEYPAGWTALGIVSEDVTITAEDYNLTYGENRLKLLWLSPEGENVPGISHLGAVEFAVPADAAEGSYAFRVTKLAVMEDGGRKWEQGTELTAALTLRPCDPNQEPTPEAVFTADGPDCGTLDNLRAGMKYSLDGGAHWTAAADTSVRLTGLTPCTITVVMPGDGVASTDSDEQRITVTKAEKPDLKAVRPDAPGGLGGIPTTEAHELSTDGRRFTACAGETGELEPGAYYVRVRAAGTVLASDSQTVTVLPFVPTYTLRFDAGGGSGTMADETVPEGDYALPVCRFDPPTGKEYRAWSIRGLEYLPDAVYYVAEDTVVTALWQDLPSDALATVRFHLLGGTAGDLHDGESRTYVKDDEGRALPVPTREGYGFQGWFDRPEGGARFDAVSADLPGDLYAQWSASGGSGSGSGDRITVTFRLIGAKRADKDVDLGAEEYLPDYVTWIPTTTYELDREASVYDLWVKATGDADIRSEGAEQNYVRTVFAPEGYALSEFTNGKRSGWMYTINGQHPGFGLREQALRDGDRVIWHYVNDYSYEVADWFEANSQWPSLGDGRFYNRWLKAPDSAGGAGGGLGAGAKSGGSGGTAGLNPSYDEDALWLSAVVETGTADGTLGRDDVSEGLEKALEKGLLKLWVDMEDANGLLLRIEPQVMGMIAEAGVGLRVECARGVVEIGSAAAAKLAERGGEVRFAVWYNDFYDRTRISITVNRRVADVPMKVELPAEGSSCALAILGADGSALPIGKSAVLGDRAYAVISGAATLVLTDNTRWWSDVRKEDRFSEGVYFCVSHGLMRGVSRFGFGPGEPMTEAMLVKVLYRLENAPEADDAPEPEVWYGAAAAWAAEAGLFGDGEPVFEPDGRVTRELLAAVLFRYGKLVGLDTGDAGDVSRFRDGDEAAPWAREAMAWAAENGLLRSESAKLLEPKALVTRWEAAEVVERLVKLIVKNML